MSDTKSTGMGFCGWLAILFIGLKLTGFISWSWWWVTAPLWMPAAFLALVFLVALVVTLLFGALTR